jgi:hypothetical protein
MASLIRRTQRFIAAKFAIIKFLLFEVGLTTTDIITDTYTAYDLYRYGFVVPISTLIQGVLSHLGQ